MDPSVCVLKFKTNERLIIRCVMRTIREELRRHQRHLSNNASVNISVILSGTAGALATYSDGNAAPFPGQP